MAFRAVVVVALLALASAGLVPHDMNMMGMGMNMGMGGNMGMGMGGNMGMNMGMGGGMQQGGGCNPATGSGCTIPAGVDVGDYIQQQMQQQQYETQQGLQRLKAQFEAVMKEVTEKKHRYAMSVMTEFTSMCACAQQTATIYQTMFVENAKVLNITDVVGMDQMGKLPYQAASAKEARELIFAGMVTSLCTSLGEFMNFAQQVENNIPIFENRVTTPSGVGK